jgi:hypothetical protein
VPTVEDALLFSELNEEQEEQNTTQYLNHIQDLSKQSGVINDSANWTGEDRRTALWWLFIATNDTPTMAVSYECPHCEEAHYLDVSLPELADTSTVLNKSPEAEIHAHFAGRLVKGIKVAPLNGHATEALEMLKNVRDMHEKGTVDWKEASRELVLNELAYALTLPDQPDDRLEAQAYRVELIKGMALDTEFRSLCAKVEAELRKMRHGLLTRYKDASYYLVATQSNCPKAIENGEDESKVLLLPFRCFDYFPAL